MVRETAVRLRDYVSWVRQLPTATGFLFAARTPLGRSMKMFLFGIGVILPLGSIIWMALFWHGNTIGRTPSTEHPLRVACDSER